MCSIERFPSDERCDGSFSVVIPLFNKANFICRAVESVLCQTQKPKEIIVVDDGSTDGGASLLSRYSDKGVVVLTQENKGVGPARNAGAAKSSGAWVAFLDGDDAWMPNHLAELSELAARFPESGLLATKYIEANTDDNDGDNPTQPRLFVRSKVDYFSEAANNLGFVWSSAVAVKRKVFGKVGGFGNAKVGEDTEFWARVALEYPVAASNRITSVYYRGTGGVIEGLRSDSAPAARVGSLPEVAPVLRTLCERAEAEPALFESDSVRAYINGRLLLGIRSNILKGRLSRARSFSELMLKPIEKRFIFWKVFLLLPDPIVKAVIWLRQKAKNLK